MLINNALENLQLKKVNHIAIVSPKESTLKKGVLPFTRKFSCKYLLLFES